ncbi:DUF308 domain-containing protein [Nocardiopsis ganjiahuensis]|uniref:DUF308 domain-containing protein n=1 Tax=Nocardiopsis ganjiahuensis TaxID=239984 RepID=UPI00034D6717|nr:DUF308 domain-containing protein [Nocardiopsis ganjiahuensis]
MTPRQHEEELPHEALPVFDPDLSEEVVAALSADPDKLLSADGPRRERKPSARTGPKKTKPLTVGDKIALGVILLILTGLLSAAVLWLTTVLMPLIWVIAAVLALGGVVMAFRAGGCLVGLLSIVLTVAALFVAEALGSTGVSWLLTGVTAFLGLALTIATVFSDDNEKTGTGKPDTGKVDTGQAPQLYRDHYVLPSDLGLEEFRFLLRVQQARRCLEPASRELGDAFDGVHADLVLRDQEWRLARLLLKQSRLRADLEERSSAAASDAVRASLRPQQDVIDASRRAVAERVEGIQAYVRKVGLAVTAQREWEQVEANVARNDEYRDLLAEATSSLPGADHLTDGAELQAIREARDTAVREALEAGTWLSNAADPV